MKKLTKIDNNLTPADKVKKLIELQKIERELKPQIEELKKDLLETMQRQDVLTLKTGSYTLSRAKRITPQVVDYDLLKEALELHNIEVITEERFAPQMSFVFKQAIEEGKKFHGLEALETEYISIRLKDK